MSAQSYQTNSSFDSSVHPHSRYNPLKGEWVLVSPHRMQRPWQGSVEEVNHQKIPEFDSSNPLCPRSKRANGVVNPDYTSVFVFTNDFPALTVDAPRPPESDSPLFQMRQSNGTCRVLCFHPKSNITIPTMTIKEIFLVINTWISEMVELGGKYEWVQIFENKGEIMGCSNPHPHCQIWASGFIPNEPKIKDEYQLKYYKQFGRPLLMDYAEQELAKMERVVVSNDDWVVVVPFWAVWPYETMVLPRKHITRFYDLNRDQRLSLAEIMKILTTKYDNLFNVSFPYSMGWHGAPTGSYSSKKMGHWVFHGMYYPPLLRSETVKKHMVGYEMLAQCQRDLTPEQAAKHLAEQPEEHYTKLLSKKPN